KDVQKSQMTAILGSVVVFGIITFVAYAVTDFVMGGAFIQGAGSIFAGTGSSSLPYPPYMTILFRYATDSVWVFDIVMIGWTAMVRAKIGALPVLYLLAIATVGLSVWIAWGSLPISLGQSLNLSILAFTVGLFVLGGMVHIVSWLWHNARGIPLSLAFKEIPP